MTAAAYERLGRTLRDLAVTAQAEAGTGAERFKVIQASPLRIEQFGSDLILEDGDPDFTIGGGMATRLTAEPLVIDDEVWCLREGATWHLVDVVGGSVAEGADEHVTGNLTVDGSTTLDGTLHAVGSTTLDGTLHVGGLGTFTAGIAVTGDANITGQYKIGGTQISALNLSNGVLGAGSVVLSSTLSGYAPLASPVFSGIPSAPTASPGTSTTQIATTAFVQAATGALTTGVSSVFGRTGAVVSATGDYSVAQVTGAAPLASPALTGNPTATTQLSTDNSTRIATTAYVKTAIAALTTGVSSVFGRSGAVVATSGDYSVAQVTGAAPLASPTFTGITTAPEFSASGLTGATAASRYVGATTSGAPGSGTFAKGDFIVTQDGHMLICTTAGVSGTWTDAGSVANVVTSVFGRTGAVVAVTGDYSVAQVTGAAPLASPALTGNPTATTQLSTDNSTRLATTAYVTTAVAALAAGVSSVFGRTGAVVAASGDYAVAQITGAAPLASPAFTGTMTIGAAASNHYSTVATNTGVNTLITDSTGFRVAGFSVTVLSDTDPRLRSNYLPESDRLKTTGSPSWSMRIGSGADQWGISRAPATSLQPSYTQLLNLDNAGNLTISGQYQIGGTQIAASNLSNGTIGTGSVVLAASPTLSGTVGGVLAFSGALTFTGGLTVTSTSPSNNVYISQSSAGAQALKLESTNGSLSSALLLLDADQVDSTSTILNARSFGASGTTLTSRFNVTVGGAIRSTSTSITTVSDARLKSDVRPLGGVLDSLCQLKVRRFRWRRHRIVPGHKAGAVDYGLIAQEVEDVFPHLVEPWGEDDVMGLRYGDLVPLLLGGVQELAERVERLEARAV